jgi:hypothetical protein
MLTSSAPRSLSDTSTMVSTRPMANTSMRSVDRSVFRETIGLPDSGWTTTPAFTSPMNAMNNPMPIPMARLRSSGMALRTASRNPVNTSAVMTRPSMTITPMAWGNVSPNPATSVKATKALSPSPDARANG